MERRDIVDEVTHQPDVQLQANETDDVLQDQVELEMLPTEPAQSAFPVAQLRAIIREEMQILQANQASTNGLQLENQQPCPLSPASIVIPCPEDPVTASTQNLPASANTLPLHAGANAAQTQPTQQLQGNFLIPFTSSFNTLPPLSVSKTSKSHKSQGVCLFQCLTAIKFI